MKNEVPVKSDFKTLIVERMRRREGGGGIGQAFVDGMQALFTRQGVDETPLLLLRVEDILANYLLVLRAEKVLDDELARQATDPSKPVAPGFEENIGKVRERLRKSMKELEESCAKAGTPIDIGLADVMKPILKKAEGVLENALRTGPRKRRAVRGKVQAAK